MATTEQTELLETHEQKYQRRRYRDMYISRDIILSDAIRQLSGKALWVYMIFLTKKVMKPFEGGKSKRSRKGKYYIENQGEITFTYGEALEKHGMTRPLFARAISQLVEFGFIDIAKTGSGLHKDVSLYGISDRWQQFGTNGFVADKRPKRLLHYGFTRGHKPCNKEKLRHIQHTQTLLEGANTSNTNVT